ncbi:MAG TPA: hypothetical protein VFP58_08935 [Candidatus Eisenbacteria bacterium]|nr:hypothetical protein [Candidatus Eisenbacteria bacterium]
MKPVPVYLCRPIVSTLMTSLLLSSGCAGWRTVSRDELVRDVRDDRPKKVRVFYPDSTLEMSNPVVRADSLVGKAKVRGAKKPIAIPLAAVDSAAVYRDAVASHARPIVMSAMIFALVLFLFFPLKDGV